MPHDAKGREVKPGDTVTVTFTVKEVYAGNEYCNASLETVLPMFPADYNTQLTINTKQCELVELAE